MRCPKCNYKKSKAKRTTDRSFYVTRRRLCLKCNYAWSTYEVYAGKDMRKKGTAYEYILAHTFIDLEEDGLITI